MSTPLTPGMLLRDRYRIREAIAEGGMGRTYLAEDLERFCEPCVIKEFLAGRTGPKERELFAREAAVLYQIDHPQIPRFRGHFEEGGRLFLVQEYIDGVTLRELLQERQTRDQVFPESEVVELLLQILPVLGYLHRQNILHRDVSPENLMVRSRDRLPMLIDFGASKEVLALATENLAPEGHGITATVVGKFGYAPPEQLQTGQAFPNSDLYALAVTAVELLTGQNPAALYNARELRWEWHDAAAVSPVLANILDRMLARQPGQRYRSAEEVLTEFVAWKSVRQQPKTVVATVAKTVAAPPYPLCPPPPNPPGTGGPGNGSRCRWCLWPPGAGIGCLRAPRPHTAAPAPRRPP
ncbi:MAG: serine/threonine protein kinase [Oscillatoriales cyanobacterium SM2_1_8]|nr:serine/threonine protein kinase [Oscillatoriales cyanobacterium SM2_1_8]